jgi:hypothetical protein
MSESNQESRSGPLPETLRRRLVRAADTYGLARTRRAVGLSDAAFWRAYGGGGVYHGTLCAVERGLRILEREAP